MTARNYYQHIRSLGSFRAVDAIELAREAEMLDKSAEMRRVTPPPTISRETLADGSNPINLSFGIRVF